MGQTKFVSISFQSGIKQQIPPTLLPPNLLTEASNLIIKETGRLENRADFRQLSGLKLPDNAGKPLKLFTYNDALFAITDKNILLWEESTNSWRDFVTKFRGISGGRFRNMNIRAFPITQKESDVQTLAFARFGDAFVFFYTYKSVLAPQKTFYYKIWNISEQRVEAGGERQFSVEDIGENAITGMFALQNDEPSKELWVGLTWAGNFTVFKFNPFLTSFTDKFTPSPAIPNIRRFVLHKDRIFYTIDGTTVQSQVFNPTATIKANVNEVTTIPDPSDTALDFSNVNLYDFQKWVDFSYTPDSGPSESFRVVWSVQTGFYIINANNRIVGHLYGNFTPYNRADPPRMFYLGNATQVESKLYLPILRSGQPEVVNRDAITDRIVPQGQQLAVFRPLGLELLELDFSTLSAPQTEQIDQQMLISGPLLSWTDGQSISEYSFSERPQIVKTPNVDYDRWPYSELDITLPSVAELARNQYSEITLPFEKKVSPFLVEGVTFTAGGAWKAEATQANRTMRQGTKTSDGTAVANKGVLNSVTYSATVKALVFEWTGWTSGDEYPRSGLLNGVKYNFHDWELASGTLKAFFYADTNPLVTGNDYEVKIPESTSLASTDVVRDIQIANDDNRQTNLKIERVRLTRAKDVTVEQNLVAGETRTPTARLAFLNQQRHRGALESEAVRSAVGVSANVSSIEYERDSSKDITLDKETRWTGSVSNGSKVWFVDNSNDRLQDTDGRTIQLPAEPWEGGTGTADTLWVISLDEGTDGVAKAFSVTGRRMSNLDIDVGSAVSFGRFGGGVSDGTTLWFLNFLDNKAYAWNVSNRQRNSSKDITLGSGTWTAVGYDGTNLWFINRTSDTAIAFSPSTLSAVSGQTISLPSDERIRWKGGGSDGTTLWFLSEVDRNTVPDGARAYSVTNPIPVSLGTLSNTSIGGNISLAGLWTTGTDSGSSSGDFYMLFSGTNVNFATGQALDTALLALINKWIYKEGDNIYNLIVPSMFADKTFYTVGNNRYVRYKIPDWATAQQLRDIILDSSLLEIDFISEDETSYVEAKAEVQPDFLSFLFQAFDENGAVKNINADDLKDSITFYKPTDRNENSNFTLADTSFKKAGAKNKYFISTLDNPLPYGSGVFNFDEDMLSAILRYPLVDVVPTVTVEASLSAFVYNYKCQFKWLDENGLEHRSQFSDIVQLISNTPIGIAGNQPTFDIKHLNLTNKGFVTVAIEIYRTKENSRTFQFLKAIPSDTSTEQTVVIDDVEDSGLGAPSGPDNVLLSGAKYVTAYKGRFVLYGFPDKSNRVVVSSPRQPFSNNAIAFKQANLPGDLIELLMEQEVVSVRAMDNYLLIFCKNKAFVWSINEGSTAQQNPAPVTGLSSLTADSFNSSVEVTDGVMFNTSEGRGVHLVTRGLQWQFRGEAVKNAFTKGKVQDLCNKSNSEEVVIIKEANPDDPDQPLVFIYNERYKQWSSWDNTDLVSCAIWKNKLTALSERGEVFQETDENPSSTRVFQIKTGWLAFSQGYMNFQRLRDLYLLAEFRGLTALSLKFEYDFIDGNKEETISFDLTGYEDSPNLADRTIGGLTLRDKKEWRFQPRQQQCSSVRITVKGIAEIAKFDSIRFGIDAGRAISGQAHQVSQRS